MHKSNPKIVEVARKMGRTPSSLAIKLCNFASFDPVLKARGIKGMTGAAEADKTLWQEFHRHIGSLGPESEQLLHDLFTSDNEKEVDLLSDDNVRIEPRSKLTAPSGSTETTASVKVRRGQQFFRQTILNSYGIRCCISGINVPSLLVASHIKPWSLFPSERLNPRNGLCLSTLHDAAFDAGLISLDENLNVILSKNLRRYFPQPALEQNFAPHEGKTIRLPEKLAEPDLNLLDYHRNQIFQK